MPRATQSPLLDWRPSVKWSGLLTRTTWRLSVKANAETRTGTKIAISDLTPSERVLAIAWTVAPSLPLVGGVVLAATSPGTSRAVGIVLLLVGLIAAAVPISPVLRRLWSGGSGPQNPTAEHRR